MVTVSIIDEVVVQWIIIFFWFKSVYAARFPAAFPQWGHSSGQHTRSHWQFQGIEGKSSY